MNRTIRFLLRVVVLALLVTLLTPAPATPNGFFEGKTQPPSKRPAEESSRALLPHQGAGKTGGPQ